MNNHENQYAVDLNTETEVLLQDVEYEFIKVKILDCRSGEAIPNCRVKKLVVLQDGNSIIETSYERNDAQLNSNDNAEENSLRALYCLYMRNADETENAPGTYNADAVSAYNEYWQVRADNEVPEWTEVNIAPPEAFYSLITLEYNSHYQTDSNGLLNLRIPQNLFDGHEISIEIGFWDVPVFLEEIGGDVRDNPIRREEMAANNCVRYPTSFPANGATGFNISWNGTQNNQWNGNWGWEATKEVTRTIVNTDTISPPNWDYTSETLPQETTEQNTLNTEFKVSETIVIKNTNAAFNNDSILNNEFSEIMSVFYDNTVTPGVNNPHFVLFAMQWYQPVWDGIKDNPSGEVGAITEDSYIQHEGYHGMNIHLVTHKTDLGGSDLNGGKGYGKMEACPIGFNSKYRTANESWGAHQGFDLHAIIGANIFAIRGGDSTAGVASTDATHYTVNLQWEALANGARRSIKYLHLSQEDRFTGYALCGRIIGKAGRSGNLGWTSQWAGHVHLNVGSYPDSDNLRYSSRLYETNKDYIDDYNLKVIPTNDLPLMLPCKCQMGNPSGTGTYFNCNFDGDNAKGCWAAWELKCPAMSNMNNGTEEKPNMRIIQAQLKYLNYYVGTPYSHGLDGNMGNNTRAAIICYKQNTANANLPDARGNVVNYNLTSNQQKHPIVQSIERENAFSGAGDIDATITQLLLDRLNLETQLPNDL